MTSLKSLTILISGGSSGLGLCLARTALASNHKVIATSRNISKARNQHPDIEQAGGTWFELDVNNANTTDKISALVQEKNINVIINNAGYAALGAFEDFTEQQAQDQFDTNVHGLLRVCRGAIPHFRERKDGVIVNIGSGAGIRGLQTRTLYSATKFAVAGISESLYFELQPFGIRVILAELGAFATAFGDNVVYPAKDTEAYKDTVTGQMLQMSRSGAITGVSAGRPEAAAERILEAITQQGLGAEMQDDMRLVLGGDCMRRLKQKMDELNVTIERNKNIAVSTDSKQY